MKSFIAVLLGCIAGIALSVPARHYRGFERYVVPQTQQAVAGNAAEYELEFLLPFGGPQQPNIGFPSQGFIRQEVPHLPGRASYELIFPFGGRQAVVPMAPGAPEARAPAPAGEDEDQDD